MVPSPSKSSVPSAPSPPYPSTPPYPHPTPTIPSTTTITRSTIKIPEWGFTSNSVQVKTLLDINDTNREELLNAPIEFLEPIPKDQQPTFILLSSTSSSSPLSTSSSTDPSSSSSSTSSSTDPSSSFKKKKSRLNILESDPTINQQNGTTEFTGTVDSELSVKLTKLWKEHKLRRNTVYSYKREDNIEKKFMYLKLKHLKKVNLNPESILGIWICLRCLKSVIQL